VLKGGGCSPSWLLHDSFLRHIPVLLPCCPVVWGCLHWSPMWMWDGERKGTSWASQGPLGRPCWGGSTDLMWSDEDKGTVGALPTAFLEPYPGSQFPTGHSAAGVAFHFPDLLQDPKCPPREMVPWFHCVWRLGPQYGRIEVLASLI
jgi:hypothetical protein